MSLTWTDTFFPGNHFTDSVYTILSGVEGTTFSVGPVAPSYHGVTGITTTGVTWENTTTGAQQGIQSNFQLEVTVTPTGRLALGLMDSTGTNGMMFVCDFDTGITTLVVSDSSVPGSTFTQSGVVGPPLGMGSAQILTAFYPNGMLWGWPGGEGSGPFKGTGLLYGQANPTVMAALASRSLYPYASLSGIPGTSIIEWDYEGVSGYTDWHYTSSASPPIPAPVVYEWTYNSPSGPPPNPVFKFDGTASSEVSPGRVVAWDWFFDDGTTATGPYAQKEYQYGSGEHIVTLMVTDVHGVRDSVSHTLVA